MLSFLKTWSLVFWIVSQSGAISGPKTGGYDSFESCDTAGKELILHERGDSTIEYSCVPSPE